MTIEEMLKSFVYAQVDQGFVFISDMAFITLGEERHSFYVWALRGPQPDLLIDQFKRDIQAWVKAAGDGPTIVMRRWPEMEPQFEGGYQLSARMLVVNRFYRDVPPPFMPKPEGEDAREFGGTDE